MSAPKVLLLGSANDRIRARLAEVFEVVPMGTDLNATVAAHGSEIAYCLAMGHGNVGGAFMDALPNLKAISNHGVGYDAIDTSAAIDRGIVVTHTPDVLNDEVANTAIMLMLACARNLVQDEAYLRAGRWEAEGNAPLSRGVRDRVVGIVGMGRIGQTIVEKLTVFGTKTVYHSRTKKEIDIPYYADLTEMAAASDFLIVITPGGAATRHLINSEVLDALGPDGTLINIARGSVVDEAALIAALQERRLGGAGLDVFEAEPSVPAALIAMDRVVLLPHVGSATIETRQAMGDLAVDNLIAHYKTGSAIRPVPECKDM